MSDQDHITISAQDVGGVAEKLKALMQDLPEDERTVLGVILSRAAVSEPSDAELENLDLGDNPFDVQLEQAVGLAQPGQDRAMARGTSTITGGWAYKFG